MNEVMINEVVMSEVMMNEVRMNEVVMSMVMVYKVRSSVMIELLRCFFQKAAMSVAPLVITSQREEVIDFTLPFCTSRISALGLIPTGKSFTVRFTDPLSASVWATLSAVLVVVSFFLYVIDRVTPISVSSADRPASDGSGGGRLDLSHSFWFALSTMALNGTAAAAGNSGIVPRTTSGRLLAAGLWLFSIAVVSLYTAKMAAILTTNEMERSRASMDELLVRGEARFGTVRNGEIASLLETSSIPMYRHMWQTIYQRDMTGPSEVYSINQKTVNDIVESQDEGWERIRNSGSREYYFLWHHQGNRYQAATDNLCELESVESRQGTFSFGIGLQAGSPKRDLLNAALLKLIEDGVLHNLENK